ncbi:MAG: hypothetical protein PHS48_00115 [Bacteroidales bacterium]|nr:hypothetical protein [Bacteroidales bacterium]
MWLDYFLYFTYIIFFVAIGLTLYFGLKGMFENIKSSIIPLASLFGIIILFLLSWALTDGQEVTSSNGVILASAGQSHFVSASLNMVYIVAGAAILSAVYTAVSSAYNK